MAKRARSNKARSAAPASAADDATATQFEHFEKLPWHSEVCERLDRLRSEQRLPNAIALTCAPGWGDRNLLAEAARVLLEDTSDRAIGAIAHPDFRWIVPEGAVIKIDQVRRINDLAVQTAQLAPRKVVAIADAHLFNVNAANALLKMLEEPPPNTHLLLGTAHWGKLLPTIRSRCQRFTSVPDQALAAAWLSAQGIAPSPQAYAQLGHAPLNVVASKADASDGLALEAWLGSLDRAPLADAVAAVDEQNLVDWLGRWYRHIVHLQSQMHDATLAPAMHRFADELLQLRRQIATSNAANSRLLLEYLIVQWRKVMSG